MLTHLVMELLKPARLTAYVTLLSALFHVLITRRNPFKS